METVEVMGRDEPGQSQLPQHKYTDRFMMPEAVPGEPILITIFGSVDLRRDPRPRMGF